MTSKFKSISSSQLKPAIFHDWLTGMRGGEKCLEAMLEVYPNAEVFTLILDENKISKTILKHKIHVHPLGKLPGFKTKYRTLIPLLPILTKGWPKKLDGFDFVLSSSHCVSKSFKTHGLKHFCYCYSPMRYIWDMFDDYFLKEEVSFFKKNIMKLLRKPLQKWDKGTAKQVDQFIAISDFIGERIKNCYDRESLTIYPFADLDFYTPTEDPREDFYLVVSALVPYKNIDLVVKAFNENGKKLVIVGTGPELNTLQNLAKNNIQFKGWASNEEIRHYYRTAKAFIFPGIEDFGITPVEAMACHCPVIAIRKGGTCETLIDIEKDSEHGTALFFDECTKEHLNSSIHKFESKNYIFSNQSFGQQSQKFSLEKFKKDISELL